MKTYYFLFFFWLASNKAKPNGMNKRKMRRNGVGERNIAAVAILSLLVCFFLYVNTALEISSLGFLFNLEDYTHTRNHKA